MWLRIALSAFGLGALVVVVACVTDEAEDQDTLCDPGTHIFCRCRGGAPGTKQCLGDGKSFGPCESSSGECEELPPGTTTTTGGQGGATLPGSGGSPPPAPGELLATCAGDADCGDGMTCPMGYCTKPCGSYEECVPPAPAEPGDCVAINGTPLCMPYCISQDHCTEYGESSRCSYSGDALPPWDVVVCADWDPVLLPPDGYPPGDMVCVQDVVCNLGYVGTERVCDYGDCTDGCHIKSDCTNGEDECSSDGSYLGECGSGGTPGDDCPGVPVNLSLANSYMQIDGDTSTLPTPSEIEGTAGCTPGASATEEFVYAVMPADSGSLIILVEPDPSYDPQVYVRSGSCATGTQVGCSDEPAAGLGEIIEIPVTANEKVWVFVDGWDGSTGPYSIEFDLSP